MHLKTLIGFDEYWKTRDEDGRSEMEVIPLSRRMGLNSETEITDPCDQ